MNKISKISQIKQTLADLDQIPYGVTRNHGTIPPSVHHYERLINDLITSLLSIDHQNIDMTIDKIISIRDNQVRELHLRKNSNFNTYGIDREMENITSLIHMHIDNLLS